jgi:hypothetical protein
MAENQNSKKHLKIIVPYRDRAEHLRDFLPHICEYLDDSDISYNIVIAEQAEGLPFNRGAMKNAGFLLGGASDYTCFHDVDYLPLNADYSWTDNPACLVFVGAVGRPIKISDSTLRLQLNNASFFGGVVLIPDAIFRQIDGYSNDYWGWGFEDTDIARRFETAKISCIRRSGVFCPLAHDSLGYEANGGMNADAALNRLLFSRKWRTGRLEDADGLSTLSYEILSRETLNPLTNGSGRCEQIKVRLLRR